MNVGYVIAPFAGWLVSGTLKFLINSAVAKRPALEQIGYGGLPSTHTSVVATPMFFIALRDGWDTPAFSVAAALLCIVVIDAMSLRREIGGHARLLNRLLQNGADAAATPLRERMGHRGIEVLAGLLVGLATAAALVRIPQL